MRKNIAAGNWKMNLDKSAAVDLANGLCKGLDAGLPANTEVILAPSAALLDAVFQTLEQNLPGKINLAGQNLHQAGSGAFTGENSAAQLKSVGCSHVLIGHSERRQYFAEDNELLSKKIRQALDSGLKPIYCIGETLSERQKGSTMQVLEKQMAEATDMFSAEEFSQMVIAYEPVWAIGTGMTASPEQAQEVHAFLRHWIRDHFGENVANGTSILYGGSVKPANAKTLFAQPDIDGGLVGGASLKADDFLKIIHSF